MAEPTIYYGWDATGNPASGNPAGGSMPVGIIVMWSGLLINIPTGWALCNGLGGTPDLRDRFIVGAAASADPGATGGANTHTHISHSNHIATQPAAHTDHVDVISHTHNQMRHATTTGSLTGIVTAPDASSSNPQVMGPQTATPAGSVSALSHSAHTGSAVDGHSVHDSPDSRPPYYSLAFIMKV